MPILPSYVARQLNEATVVAGGARSGSIEPIGHTTNVVPLLELAFSEHPRRRKHQRRHPALKGLTAEAAQRRRVQIAVVPARNLIILRSQLQPLLILLLVTRPVYPGGPSPFQGSWR